MLSKCGSQDCAQVENCVMRSELNNVQCRTQCVSFSAERCDLYSGQHYLFPSFCVKRGSTRVPVCRTLNLNFFVFIVDFIGESTMSSAQKIETHNCITCFFLFK